jgi:exodeoxyribonuclease VII large subunit
MPGDGFDLPARDVWTISRLNREVRLLVESGLPALWIEGEVSNLARPASGHLYFSLKDETAQVRCALWRSTALKLACTPRNGMQLLVRARVTLYEPRGEYQLAVEYAEEAGEGALRRRFEELKARLREEGLFDEAARRPLPRLPRRIGVITSPSGAAIRDILHVLRRRCSTVPVVIYPVPVQGEGAAARIAAMLALASQRAECDVLILARGGGSLEDLWSFNEEIVARAIRASVIPVIAGIGHEVDVTIADFAADRRAPTPSGAAEIAVPDAAEWLARLNKDTGRLNNAIARRLSLKAERLAWQVRCLALAHPGNRLRQHGQRLDDLELRLKRAFGAGLDALKARAFSAIRTLHTVSPLATLERGYAIATRATDGAILRSASQVAVGDGITVTLAEGGIEAQVTHTTPGKGARAQTSPSKPDKL